MLSDTEKGLLVALFREAYAEPKLLNARYMNSDLQERARANGISAEMASAAVNALIQNKMLSRSRSTSGIYTEYSLTRAAVNYLASRNLEAKQPIGFLTDVEKKNLVTLLSDAEEGLSFVKASNSEKAMARAFLVAARTLSEAPDPPSDLIWELINRASQVAGIASLLVSIFALFAAAGR